MQNTGKQRIEQISKAKRGLREEPVNEGLAGLESKTSFPKRKRDQNLAREKAARTKSLQ